MALREVALWLALSAVGLQAGSILLAALEGEQQQVSDSARPLPPFLSSATRSPTSTPSPTPTPTLTPSPVPTGVDCCPLGTGGEQREEEPVTSVPVDVLPPVAEPPTSVTPTPAPAPVVPPAPPPVVVPPPPPVPTVTPTPTPTPRCAKAHVSKGKHTGWVKQMRVCIGKPSRVR